MVGLNAEVSEQKGRAAGMRTAGVRLDGGKHCVILCQRLGIIRLQDPTLLVRVVLIEDAEIHGMIPIRSSPPPGPGMNSRVRSRVADRDPRHKNQRFTAGI